MWLKDQTTGRSETFGEAERHVTNVGVGLAKVGVGAGTVVCIWTSNYVEYWLVSWDNGGRIKCIIRFLGDHLELIIIYPHSQKNCRHTTNTLDTCQEFSKI